MAAKTPPRINPDDRFRGKRAEVIVEGDPDYEVRSARVLAEIAERRRRVREGVALRIAQRAGRKSV